MLVDGRDGHVFKSEGLTRMAMITLFGLLLLNPWPSPSHGADLSAERQQILELLLRVQAFNKVFEGFDSYIVTIESDQLQADGSREVIAVASGRFLGQEKRLKVEFLVVGEQVIGGQILEHADLPPCTASSQQSSL